MRVRPRNNVVLFEEYKIIIVLKPQQRWKCVFHKDYISVERDNVTLKLSKEEFEKYFK